MEDSNNWLNSLGKFLFNILLFAIGMWIAGAIIVGIASIFE